MRDDRERLADVLAAIERIRRYVQDDRTRFDTDELRRVNTVTRDLPKLQESSPGSLPSLTRKQKTHGE